MELRHRLPGVFMKIPPLWLPGKKGNKKALIPKLTLGTRTEKTIFLRYHLVCRRSDHLMQMPTHPLPNNAGIASEDTRLLPFPLPSAAHLPVCLPPCSQRYRTLCGSNSRFYFRLIGFRINLQPIYNSCVRLSSTFFR